MERVVLPELLDMLPPRDRSALRSRRDIHRLNILMKHPGLMAGAVPNSWPEQGAREIVELGAGDGRFLLSVARRMINRPASIKATLVDRMDVLESETRAEFESLGWQVEVQIAEAAEWLRQTAGRPLGTVVSNLFLHQFGDKELREMLRLMAEAAQTVIALEPRRGRLPRFCGRFLWLAGCGSVTRYDGQVSIRAGFAGCEISALWPDDENWKLQERPVGLFSHLFIAQRKNRKGGQ